MSPRSMSPISKPPNPPPPNPPAPKLGVHARVAELVVLGPLLLVGQHFVGLIDLLELGLGILVTGVQVGVVFFGQLTVGFFQFVVRDPFGTPRTS